MITIFDAKIFKFSKAEKMIQVDKSRLDHEASGYVFADLFGDRTVFGFKIRSHKTDNIAVFRVTNVEITEGEIQGWELEPMPATLDSIPRLAGFKLKVENT